MFKTLITIFVIVCLTTNLIYGAPDEISLRWEMWQPQNSDVNSAKIPSAPIPANGKNNDPLPGKTYFYQKLADGIYWVVKDAYCAMFVVTSTGVVVIDAPPAIGQDLISAVKDVTNLPITHLIYSHMHTDHVGSAYLFQNVERIGQEETAKLLQKRQDPNRPAPTRTFTDSLTLQIGGKTIQLDYKGRIHMAGNIFVWFPNEKILFSVDVVYPGWAPFTRLGVAEDVVLYIEATDVILTYPFTYFVSGHFGKLGTRQDVLDHKEYIRDVQQNAIIAYNRVNVADFIKRAADPKNFAAWYDVYTKEKVRICSELTQQKWLSRFGGVDVYTQSNCDVIGEAQSIDYGQKVIG